MKELLVFITVLALIIAGCDSKKESDSGILAEGAELILVDSGFAFTEGVASDEGGNVYFTDIPASRIHYYTLSDEGSIFLENSNRTNGLQVDGEGNILACEGIEGGRLVSVSQEGEVSVLADGYEGKAFNSPNDLWMDARGGVYLTDPRYGNRDSLNQDGEHVYYLTPDREKVIRVIDDMVRPNGVIGSADGSTLYVADAGDGKTFKFSIENDGTLSDKQLFAEVGSDGMTIDSRGNVYLTSGAVQVYNPEGELIETIETPEGPTNVCFAGKKKDLLYITARKSVYKIQMTVTGVGSN